MNRKVTPLLIIFVMIPVFTMPMVSAWTKAGNAIYPVKDAYVSIDGDFSDRITNYGNRTEIVVGRGLHGYCVGLLQFDFSQLPRNAVNVTFIAGVTVFGTNNRTLRVFAVEDADWDEREIIGNSNPFNVYWIYTSRLSGNITNIPITVDTEGIVINISQYAAFDGKVTMIFITLPDDESWIEMESTEGQLFNPPRIEYKLNSAATGIIWVLVFSFIGLAVIYAVVKKRNP